MATNVYTQHWFQLFMPLQAEELTQKDVTFLARQLPLPRYRRVLDLCCGYGRHALGLAAEGYDVTGLDRDEAAVAEARRRAQAAALDVAYLVGDMREIAALPGTFEAVINMWQSLSLFDDATNVAILRAIHDKLTPGGRFIVDMYNRAWCERSQGESSRKVDGATIDTHSYLDGDRWHSVLTYRDASGAIVGGDHFDWRVYTPEEFSMLASTCGFATGLICTWSDENRPPSADVARMQIVLERE